MRGRYIDFISSYCDGWCERCAFTDRCSVYAVTVALEMCEGDEQAALELAIGPPPPRTAAEATRRETFAEEMANLTFTDQDQDAFDRENEAREERIEESPVTTASERVWLLARRWLGDHVGATSIPSDASLTEALETARRDRSFIHVKLHRALYGRDEDQHGGRDDDPRQNDWNGSAKVALISIARSTTAWDLIADTTGDPDAAEVAGELRVLQREVERAFPDAWKFRRPGFDDAREAQRLKKRRPS